MKKIFSFIKNKHQNILRVFLFIVAIVLITNWFPKQIKFKYSFEEGKPWRYEDLTAPSNFPIKKSEEQLAEEVKQIKEEINPYYEVDPTIKNRQLEEFREAYSSLARRFRQEDQNEWQYRRDSLRYLQIGEKLLNRIYNLGIVNLFQDHRKKSPNFVINLITDNQLKQKQVKELFTVQSATEYIKDTLSQFNIAQKNLLESAVKNYLKPNIYYDSTTTRLQTQAAIRDISLYFGAVEEGEIIVRRGDPITEDRFQKLESYREFTKSQTGEENRLLVIIGYTILSALLLTIFGVFIYTFAKSVFNSTRKLLFILVLMIGMLYLTSWAVEATIPSYHVIPFCIVPIILRTFFGTRLALYAHLTVILAASFIVPLGIEYTTLNIVAGMVAIFTNIKAHYWSQFFVSIGFIFLTYSIGFLGISLIQEGDFTIQLLDLGWLGINVFLTLMAYPLIPIFEKLFGYVSDITLMELGDLNKPLLKELSLKAPGSFQHSLQVANLAEAAASEIGANSLLVKVGSLYHDIGKMDKPIYFIENQHGSYNPHNDLPFEESAQIIINHVIKGVDMAKKGNLPEVLVDFIRTHHGTSRVEYFYRSYIKNYPDEEVDESKFRYPGPLPYSKETAIVMMADTVEAAARSMKNPTHEALDDLIEKLIKSKIENGQFVNSDITFKEITTIKKIFKKMLHSIYHVRIEYPDELKKGKKDEELKEEADEKDFNSNRPENSSVKPR